MTEHPAITPEPRAGSAADSTLISPESPAAGSAPPARHPVAPLLPALRTAIAVGYPGWADVDLIPLPDSGLAHHHVRLGGTGALARIPKQSQLQLSARANLDHQAACFERVSESGHAPRLLGIIAPRAGLDRGALLVEFIEGRAAVVPDDLGAIMTALARIHALPVPEVRAPLGDAADPLAALADEVAVQAGYLDAAAPGPRTRGLIDAELAAVGRLVLRPDRPAKRLITFDAHPGNFVIRADGSAIIVDLEKCRYSYPALDLAHATLYTSTTWEPGATVALTPAGVADALDVWARESAVDGMPPADLAWQTPLRRLMWLWSVTWCAKWRVLSGSAV
ncbi:MAG: hypothetical protein RI885_2327, partial [Actinomycetota bacterium]